jgi:hypothetical protein
MAAPSRCLATATKNIQSPRAARITSRTFASSTSSLVASWRKVTAGNTTCLRELQMAQNGQRRVASNIQGQTRNFSQSASRTKLKTIDQIRARNKGGVRFAIQGTTHQMAVNKRSGQRLTFCSLSTLQPPSFSSQLVQDYGPISHTRRSAWHESE